VDTIGQQKMWTFLKDGCAIECADCLTIRRSPGYTVQSYLELATKVAELQFSNRDFVLLFRGQHTDYRNHVDKIGNTVLQASLFRSKFKGANYRKFLEKQFQVLAHAEELLIEKYRRFGALKLEFLKRNQIIRWSLLQHYEICPTPLLDVTQSLRVAASFASENADSEAFIFVLGVPNLGGAITANNGLQIIRLASVCPPNALRPHIQEGYLLGEYPAIAEYQQKQLYERWEIDFGRRLVAKFRFNPQKFWNADDFPKIGHDALYPPADQDPLNRMADELRSAL
jgi:hypothetical protein